MNKLLMALASLAASLVLVGCAAPFPYQTGNVQGCYRNNNGLTICSGGTGSNVPQGVYQQQPQQVIVPQAPVIIQQQGFGGQLPLGMGCPGNSYWDGRGCRIGGRNPFDNRQCPSGGRMINNSWVCMDRMSFGQNPEEYEGVDYVEPVEIFQSAQADM